MQINPKVCNIDKMRIDVSFPARLRGVDASGETFEVTAFADNLSKEEVYLRLPRALQPSTKVYAVIRFSDRPSAPCARLAVSGFVIRTEPRQDGSFGTAIAIEGHRFI